MLIAIRQKQITRPKELGNSGSFKNQYFKTDFEKYISNFEMKYYDVSETEVKFLQDG
jgi:hypothetical protein